MKNTVILITGGTGKIGKSLVQYFSKQDVRVIFTGRTPEKVKQLIIENNANQNIWGISLDHSQSDSALHLIKKCQEMNLLPTHIINNVRNIENLKVNAEGRPSNQAWSQEFYLGVVFPYELAMATLEYQAPLKRIVNISSMYGVVAANPSLYENPATDSPIHYSIVKAAQNHLTKEMAVRLVKHGVSVNSVAYGGVEGRVSESFKQQYAKLCPLGRMLNQSEIPGIVKYLLLEADMALTGQVIAVDGGWSIW